MNVCVFLKKLQLTFELNTPAALELVLMCHLGPRTRKVEIWHPELVNLCHLGPQLLRWCHIIMNICEKALQIFLLLLHPPHLRKRGPVVDASSTYDRDGAHAHQSSQECGCAAAPGLVPLLYFEDAGSTSRHY
jgi:hypothetical protein